MNDIYCFHFPIACVYMEKYSWYLILTFILRPCLVLVLVASFFLISGDYLGRCSHCLQIQFYFCLSNLQAFYCLFLSFCTVGSLQPHVFRSEEREHCCLALILGGKSNISPWRMMWALDFTYMPFIRLRKFSSISNLLGGFIRIGC